KAVVRQIWPSVAVRPTPRSCAICRPSRANESLCRGKIKNAAVANKSETAEKWTTTARVSMPFRRCKPIMASAVNTDTLTAASAPKWPRARGGRGISTTPAAPHATDSQTLAEGKAPSIGQDKSATQTGNMLVRVKTSEIGSRVSAKKVPMRLQLPAMLRIQRMRGFQKTSGTPAAIAQAPTSTRGMKERKMATVCQSRVRRSEEPTVCASTPIHENEKLPTSIQMYGRTATRMTNFMICANKKAPEKTSAPSFRDNNQRRSIVVLLLFAGDENDLGHLAVGDVDAGENSLGANVLERLVLHAVGQFGLGLFLHFGELAVLGEIVFRGFRVTLLAGYHRDLFVVDLGDPAGDFVGQGEAERQGQDRAGADHLPQRHYRLLKRKWIGSIPANAEMDIGKRVAALVPGRRERQSS